MSLDPVTAVKLGLLIAPRIRGAIFRHKVRKASKSGEVIDMDFLKKETDVNYSQVEGIVRHVLTIAGGAAVAGGYLTDAQLTAIVGGLLAVGGVLWSVWQKRKAA